MNHKLTPSSFSFLYEECKRCFYLQTVYNILRPSIPLPAVFTEMAALLKQHYNGKYTREVHKALPPGIVKYGEKRVKSKIISLPPHKDVCFISGRFDIAVKFEDGTFGVIDFKTGNPQGEEKELYSRQLHAYAYALENPALGFLNLFPVTRLGLLYFYPERTKQKNVKQLLYEADIHWVEIEKDNRKFTEFLDEVLSILESPVPPKPSPECIWCNYIDKLEKYSRIIKGG